MTFFYSINILLPPKKKTHARARAHVYDSLGSLCEGTTTTLSICAMHVIVLCVVRIHLLIHTDILSLSLTCRCLHREPWNYNVRYLLVLNLLQKAREERFPRHLCTILQRLIHVALSCEFYSIQHTSYQYQKFQLLLCASEISLQGGNITGCINHAKSASALLLPDAYRFFGHLLLSRAYAAEGNMLNLQDEYVRCLELKTDYVIGWMCLKVMESLYEVQADTNTIELSFNECLKQGNNSRLIWTAKFNLVLGFVFLWKKDFFSAEKCLAQACSLAGAESCLFLCHGIYLLTDQSVCFSPIFSSTESHSKHHIQT